MTLPFLYRKTSFPISTLLRQASWVLLFLACLAGFDLKAQTVRIGCSDAAIRAKVEQQKREFQARGFSNFKDAMIFMKSREETPVAVEMQQGTHYQILFNAHRDFKKMEMYILDQEGNKLDQRTQKSSASSTLFYSFIPPKSGTYFFVLFQQAKVKDLCGGFTIMIATPEPEDKE